MRSPLYRRRAYLIAAVSICLFAGRARQAAALILGGFGNEPVIDAGWPAGALEVANLKSRIGWWEGPPFGGGQFVFLYREQGGDKFNEALVLFAKINAGQLDLVVHDGPHESFWLRKLRGRIRDMLTHKPIAGAKVAAVKAVARAGGGYDWQSVAQGTTDDDGGYELAKVDSAANEVYLRAKGYALREVSLPSSDLPVYRKLDVELAPAESFSGRAIDEAGQPVAGVVVSPTVAMGIDGRGYGSPAERQATTDDDGFFVLTNLPRGFVQLSYRKPGMYHTPLGELLSVPGDAIAVTLVRTGVIRGQVVSAAGPVADTGVTLDQEQPQKPGHFGGKGTWGGGTNTDANGRFEFSGAPPGNYRLRSNNQTKTVSLAGGETIDVELKSEK